MKNIKLGKTYNGVLMNGSYRMEWIKARVQAQDRMLNIGVGDNLIEPNEILHYPALPVNHVPIEFIQKVFSGREYQEDV